MPEKNQDVLAAIAIEIDSVAEKHATKTPLGRQHVYTALAMWFAGEAIRAGLDPKEFLEQIKFVPVAEHYASEFAKLDKSRSTAH